MKTIQEEIDLFNLALKSANRPIMTKKETFLLEEFKNHMIRLFLSGICSGLALVGDPVEANLYFGEIEAMLRELQKEVH